MLPMLERRMLRYPFRGTAAIKFMKVFFNESLINEKLVAAGLAERSFHHLKFSPYYSENELEQNRIHAQKYSSNAPAWSNLCEKTGRGIQKQMEYILWLFQNHKKYNIYQLNTKFYQSDWDLFFWANRGWNGKDYFDAFTLTANEARTIESNEMLLKEILAMYEQMSNQLAFNSPNVQCTVVYKDRRNHAAIEKAALEIIQKTEGKMTQYLGVPGRFKKVDEGSGVESYAFFKKGARTKFFRLDAENLVTEVLK